MTSAMPQPTDGVGGAVGGMAGGKFARVSASVPSSFGTVLLGGTPVDLSVRALVAAVIPTPRFGRENEVVATVAAAASAGADLADVSHGPRLLGPVARGGQIPTCARAADLDAGAAAHAAGAALVFVPPALGPAAAERGWPLALIVDDVADIAGAGDVAEPLGLAIAIDTAGAAEADALAVESVALAEGCRIVRTSDVRRTRRVVEVVAAILEARR